MKPDRPALSLCLLVKNEERTLERCLDSVQSLHPEVVIVDTGSSDGTLSIAARCGAEITSFDFTVPDFAAARNQGLARANGRWILVLDADETLDSAGVTPIRQIAAGEENVGYFVRRLNRQSGSDRPTTDYAIRLFPNRPGYRYRGRVHETVDASILAGGGRLVRSRIRIQHDFADDPEARRRKNLWYISILNEEIAANPSDSSRLDFLAAEYHQLGVFEQAAEITERIKRMRRSDPEAHLRSGVYHLLYRDDRERAAADFLEALRLRPGYPEALSFLRRMQDGQEEASLPQLPQPAVTGATR
jgi:glycosyltransferase involved in cell wall biosynthesis